ncbi:MAG: isochorismatase family protein [Betaproteobacteria bacterium]|nr:isochorismatase family protein [Betaproteobacteria bacterium]
MRPALESAMSPIESHPGDALLVIDVQNDFLPGGCLGVPGGHATVHMLNRYIASFSDRRLPVIATRDWHPQNHCSFEVRGGVWPPHCIAGTQGAAFPSTLRLPCDAIIVSKASTADQEAHSAFEATDLCARLRDLNVRRLFVGGLATEYCVLMTVRDALRLGFRVAVLEDAVCAVDLAAGDGERALETMRRLGAKSVRLEAIAA